MKLVRHAGLEANGLHKLSSELVLHVSVSGLGIGHEVSWLVEPGRVRSGRAACCLAVCVSLFIQSCKHVYLEVKREEENLWLCETAQDQNPLSSESCVK